MFSRRSFVHSLAFATLIVLAACGGSHSDQPVALKSIDDRFPIRVGDRMVQMQIAADPGEMQKGLMYRTSMGQDEGMLFLYDKPQQMNFWMHDTEIPLNIGYFDPSGELKETYEMYPHDEKTVSSRSKNLQFALEMNQGWYGQAGMKPGARLDLKAVAEALKARGFKPETFGLR
jgi:uncharacterized protein